MILQQKDWGKENNVDWYKILKFLFISGIIILNLLSFGSYAGRYHTDYQDYHQEP